MGLEFRAIDFDEDHEPGQRLVQVYNHTADHTHVIYIDKNGESHEALSGSDPMITALLKLLENMRHETRKVTDQERKIAMKIFNP